MAVTIEDVQEAVASKDDAQALDALLSLEDDPAQPRYRLSWYQRRQRGDEVPLTVGLPSKLPSAMQWTREAWEQTASNRVQSLRGHNEATVYRIRVADLEDNGRTAISVFWRAGIGPQEQPMIGSPYQAAMPGYYGPQIGYGGHYPPQRLDVESLIAKASESVVKAVMDKVDERIGRIEDALDDDDDGPSDDALVMMHLLQRLPSREEDPNMQTVRALQDGLMIAQEVMGPRPIFAKVGHVLKMWSMRRNPNALPAPAPAPALQEAAQISASVGAVGLDMETVDQAVRNLESVGIPDAANLIRELAANPEAAKMLVKG